MFLKCFPILPTVIYSKNYVDTPPYTDMKAKSVSKILSTVKHKNLVKLLPE